MTNTTFITIALIMVLIVVAGAVFTTVSEKGIAGIIKIILLLGGSVVISILVNNNVNKVYSKLIEPEVDTYMEEVISFNTLDTAINSARWHDNVTLSDEILKNNDMNSFLGKLLKNSDKLQEVLDIDLSPYTNSYGNYKYTAVICNLQTKLMNEVKDTIITPVLLKVLRCGMFSLGYLILWVIVEAIMLIFAPLLNKILNISLMIRILMGGIAGAIISILVLCK